MLKNKQKLSMPLFLFFTITMILLTNVFHSQADTGDKRAGTVSINQNGSFTEVTMDFRDSTHYEMWSLYTQKLLKVFPNIEADYDALIARLADWYPRTDNAVFTIKNGEKSIVNIGRLLRCITAGTAFNDEGVFAALLAAETSVSADFESKTYSSVMIDIRYALENFSTLKGVAKYLSSREYTFSHQIFLADSKTSKVLENNLTGCRIKACPGLDPGSGVTKLACLIAGLILCPAAERNVASSINLSISRSTLSSIQYPASLCLK